MAKFTYLVTVEVPSEPQPIMDENVAEFYLKDEDANGKIDAHLRAEIVMRERLGCDEDYGFDYEVGYEEVILPGLAGK